jgi:hypothetical protein
MNHQGHSTPLSSNKPNLEVYCLHFEPFNDMVSDDETNTKKQWIQAPFDQPQTATNLVNSYNMGA